MDPLLIARLLVCAFFAVLFLQSGLDKVFDWKGNLGWLTGHFEKSIFRGVVPMLLASVTLVEMAAGVCSSIGLVALFFNVRTFAEIGLALAGLAFVMLFTGQRIAKDYVGAAALAPYFGVALLGLYLFSV